VPSHWKRLSEKISHVPNIGNVLDPELATLDPVLKPVEAHVAWLRHLGLDGPVGKAYGDFIIAINRRGRLRVAKVRENLTLEVRDLCSGKRAPILRFLNGRTHHGDTRGVNEDGGIEEGGVVAAREKVERPGPGHAVGVRPGQIRGVGEDVKGHGGGAKDFHAVGVRGYKSKEAVQVGHGRKRGGGLCACQRTSGGQDATVNASTIVKEIAYRYLQLFLLGGGGGWRRIGGGVLGSRQAEEGRVIDGRRCGRLDAVRAKAIQQSVDIAWVGEREGALGAIVSHGKAQELGCNGVGFDMVEAGKARNEIVVVVAILVFNAKIVDD
jgi:hypothetical protein